MLKFVAEPSATNSPSSRKTPSPTPQNLTPTKKRRTSTAVRLTLFHTSEVCDGDALAIARAKGHSAVARLTVAPATPPPTPPPRPPPPPSAAARAVARQAWQACVDAAYTDPSCANALEVSWDAATGACRCDTKASCALSSPGDASWRRLTCAEDGVGPSSAGVAPFVDALVRELSTDAGRRVSLIVYPPNADGAGDEGRGDVSGDAATRVSLRSAPPCRGAVGGCGSWTTAAACRQRRWRGW